MFIDQKGRVCLNKTKKGFLIYFLVASLVLLIGCKQVQPGGTMEQVSVSPMSVTVLDIGKADCILIATAEKTVMIDAGEGNNADEILEYCNLNQIEKLDYLIITHYDKDHVGGADKVVEAVEVEHVITPEYAPDDKQYRQFVEVVQERGILETRLKENMQFQIGDAMFYLYPPEKKIYSGDNDYSIVTRITHGNMSFVMAGDAEEERIDELLKLKNLTGTYLKVPHHGRYKTNAAAFLKKVQPKYAVITCSDKNPPEPEMIQVLEKSGCEIFETRNGIVHCESDGNQLNFSQEMPEDTQD